MDFKSSLLISSYGIEKKVIEQAEFLLSNLRKRVLWLMG
ncbi:hypothetical protein pah_c010o019 [Parachlamydia acanthamoebae str. Hall's coccus]|nr:hypothetical protein pah_c010o019 [Parachlamydia acanthamoebae str. Hall's coccus]